MRCFGVMLLFSRCQRVPNRRAQIRITAALLFRVSVALLGFSMRHKPPRRFKEEAEGYWYYPPDDLLRAIGRVATLSASIDELLHVIHWNYLDTNWDIAAIVTRDMRPSRLAEDIVRMAIACPDEDAIIQDLRDLMADYREAVERRNQLIHWVWEQPKHRRRLQHPLRPPVAKQNKHTSVSFTVKEIEKLGDDLLWIEARMRTHSLSADEFKEERERLGPFARFIVPAPWRGKRYPPIPKEWRRPAKRKRRKRRPRVISTA
jgi:hypothetical protein